MPPVSLLLLVGGGAFLVMGLIGGFFLIPKVVDSQIAKEKVLTPGSMSRGLFEKLPDPLYLKIYIWNVTNPMGVQKGEKPVLQEVGPFVYDEYKWKVKLKDRNTDDSVQYRPMSWFYYNQSLSGSLTGNEVVTIPNILFLSIVLKVQLEMYPMLGMMDPAVTELFRKPTSIYMNVKVKDLLFEGITINCTVKEFTTKTVCFQLKAENRQEVVEVSPNLFKFSFFGARNGTEGELFRANRGSKNPAKVGTIMEFKELSYLTTWRGSPCNNISGSDGGNFPPGLSTTAIQHVFIPELCRSLPLWYVKSDVHRDVPVYVYTSNLGDIYMNKTWHCFCRNKNPNSCPKKGSMDLNKCMGSPMIVTLPHFYLAAPEFLKESIGCKPDPELHKIHIEMEPNTATPLKVAMRFQFNIRIHNISRISIMKKLPRCMHPIFWIDQGIIIPDQYVNIIKDQLLAALKYIDYGKWGMILAGLAMAVVGGSMYSRQKRAVTPVEQLMSFAPNTPEGQTNLAYEKEVFNKKWRGNERRERREGRQENADLWMNEQEGSMGDIDTGYLALWRDRDRQPEVEPRGQGNRNDDWVNRDRREPQVIRNPEVEAWMNREIRGEGMEPRNGNVARDPEMEAWIRREVGGDMRGYQAPRNVVETRVRETGVGPSNPVARNIDTEAWIRETGVGRGNPVARNVDTHTLIRETGNVNPVIRNSGMEAWATRESGGIGRGMVRDSGSWMTHREGRARQEPMEARLVADMDDWASRERQGERWGPRDEGGDGDAQMEAWMKRRERPEVNRTARVGGADQWQGRNWPVRRY